MVQEEAREDTLTGCEILSEKHLLTVQVAECSIFRKPDTNKHEDSSGAVLYIADILFR